MCTRSVQREKQTHCAGLCPKRFTVGNLTMEGDERRRSREMSTSRSSFRDFRENGISAMASDEAFPGMCSKARECLPVRGIPQQLGYSFPIVGKQRWRNGESGATIEPAFVSPLGSGHERRLAQKCACARLPSAPEKLRQA